MQKNLLAKICSWQLIEKWGMTDVAARCVLWFPNKLRETGPQWNKENGENGISFPRLSKYTWASNLFKLERTLVMRHFRKVCFLANFEKEQLLDFSNMFLGLVLYILQRIRRWIFIWLRRTVLNWDIHHWRGFSVLNRIHWRVFLFQDSWYCRKFKTFWDGYCSLDEEGKKRILSV